MDNKNLQSLSAGHLRLAYVEFARTSRRPSWWGTGKGEGEITNPAGAFGLMMNELIRFRLRCEGDSEPSEERVVEFLSSLIQKTVKPGSARFTEFLHGQAGTRSDFWEDAQNILQRCLLGDQKIADDDEGAKIAKKLKKFFFEFGIAARNHAPQNERGFFDPLYQGLGCVQTVNEANAELEVLRCYLREDFKPRADVLIVRVSGFRRFLQRDDGAGMNDSGNLTLKLLNEGAIVIYVYPKNKSSSPAAQTAAAFKEFVDTSKQSADGARGRVHLLAIDPRKVGKDGGHLIAGSFLSPTLRFGYLRCTAKEVAPEEDPIISRTLIVTQKSRHSPSAYQPDRRELEAFERWLDRFVLCELQAKVKRAGLVESTK